MKIVMNLILFGLILQLSNICIAQTKNKAEGDLVIDSLTSLVLQENKIHLTPLRKVYVFLPASYKTSRKSYPVVFYLHTVFSNPTQVLQSSDITVLLNKAFESGLSKEFILVIPDCSSPTSGSFYENSVTSGRWLDYITQELIPFVDKKFHSIAKKESRAIIGDMMGGRGALLLAMTRPDLFSTVYALHPVATGIGNIPWVYLDIDWKKIHAAKSYDELPKHGYAPIFIPIQQAFLPNANRPPFYCDFMYEPVNGEMKLYAENMQKAKEGFLLDYYVERNKQNLMQLKGIAFDWGRFDPNQEHVISAQRFSMLLQDFGIPHEAEEYAGLPWTNNWTQEGRFYKRVLPFLNHNLQFNDK